MLSLIEDERETLAELCRQYGVARLEVFGSAADDTFDPERSDIDFLVEFQPGVDLGPWMAGYFDFKAELEELFGHRVDLVMPSALNNRYFVREVNRTRRLLYAT